MSPLRDLLRDTLRQADHLLLVLCVTINLFGIALIYSATRYDAALHSAAIKQGVAMLFGIVLFFVFSQLDPEVLLTRWPWLLGGSVLFIALLAIPGIGHTVGNNRNWISFSVFSLQPAEIVKFTFTLLLAKLAVAMQNSRGIRSPLSVAALSGFSAFFVLLIYVVSGDAGSALVYGFIFLTVAWCAGVRPIWFIWGGIAAVLGGAWLWITLPDKNYWKMRILVCLNHDLDPTYRGFQQTRSLLAIQSGKLSGMGYLHGNLTQASYSSALPARQTDFIFSVCCEEFGLIGGLILLGLLTALIVRCFHIALTASKPLYGLAAMGFTGMLMIQVVLNIGMCLFVLPVIGLTLPLVSAGGSSVITVYAAMGVLSGIRQKEVPRWLQDANDEHWADQRMD